MNSEVSAKSIDWKHMLFEKSASSEKELRDCCAESMASSNIFGGTVLAEESGLSRVGVFIKSDPLSIDLLSGAGNKTLIPFFPYCPLISELIKRNFLC